MADVKTKDLPVEATPLLTDFAVMTKSGGGTRKTTWQKIKDLLNIGRYKTYEALLSQSGSGAPTSIILYNDLGGLITLSRVQAGSYNLTSAGLFTLNKTGVLISSQSDGTTSGVRVEQKVVDINTIHISTTGADSKLNLTLIEIRVYL